MRAKAKVREEHKKFYSASLALKARASRYSM